MPTLNLDFFFNFPFSIFFYFLPFLFLFFIFGHFLFLVFFYFFFFFSLFLFLSFFHFCFPTKLISKNDPSWIEAEPWFYGTKRMFDVKKAKMKAPIYNLEVTSVTHFHDDNGCDFMYVNTYEMPLSEWIKSHGGGWSTMMELGIMEPSCSLSLDLNS